jgi:hypothetical protein
MRETSRNHEVHEKNKNKNKNKIQETQFPRRPRDHYSELPLATIATYRNGPLARIRSQASLVSIEFVRLVKCVVTDIWSDFFELGV